MKLKHQLILACSTLLLIPWVIVAFLRANEAALQTLQQQLLEATALSIADGLFDQSSLLYPDPKRLSAPLDTDSLLATSVTQPPVLDGYFDDWPPIGSRQFGTRRRPVDIQAVVHANRLYLAIFAADSTKRYQTPGTGPESMGDHLLLRLWRNGQYRDFVMATSAPGTIRAEAQPSRLAARPDDSEDAKHGIFGVWADVAKGHQIELTLPLPTAGSRLGIEYVDADEGGTSRRGNIDSMASVAPPWLIHPTQALNTLIQRYNGRAVEVSIYDRWGWSLARSRSAPPKETAAAPYLIQWLYRRVLSSASPPPTSKADGRIENGAIADATRGNSSHNVIARGSKLTSYFATPIESLDGIIGVVVTEQPRDRYLSLTASAFGDLLFKAGLAIALILATILAFSALLTRRIRQLTKTTQQAPDLTQRPLLPVSPLGDEIDTLAQQFNKLLDQQRQSQDYLRNLPRHLAHEIRTPVAIISTSLDQLAHPDTTPEERDQLLRRAQTGKHRLIALLDAMNEASRLENSIEAEPFHSIDLVILLRELTEAYRQTYPDWHFQLITDSDAAAANASAELLVQALDKLVNNATSFADRDSTITLQLSQRGLWWRLSVANRGPELPADPEKLFSPMVSLREAGADDKGHMGLGLYIVSLIALRHGGQPWAQNQSTDDGVEIGFSIRASSPS